MTALTPLVELATQKSLDLFFRVGRGYVVRATREGAHGAGGVGLSPFGIQSRAEARIVTALGHRTAEHQLHAWPCNEPRRPSLR